MGLVHLYEPLRTVAEYLHVIRLVGVIAQRLKGLPHRHVDHNGGVIVIGDVRGIPRFRLEPPHKARSLVPDGIDGRKLRDKFRDLRIVERSNQASNIDLRKMVVRGGPRETPSQRRFRS